MYKIFHIVSNKEWGGGEQYVYDLAQRQRADGISVSVFCKPVDSISQKYENTGMNVATLHLGGMLDFWSARSMAEVIGKAGPCTVHAHNFKDAFTACYARKLSGNKQVRVVMCRHLTRKGKNTLPYRWLYDQLDCLVFDSELSRDTFLSTGPEIAPDKLRVIHTSIVSHGLVKPLPIREEFGIAGDRVVGMYHGRLDPEKGLDTLLDAMTRLKDVNICLVLVGKGSEEYTAHLKQLIRDNGLKGKVILAGFRSNILHTVAAADFGILASTVQEGCPLSPQEYMSQGRPVVATDNGGQREYIVDGKNGLLVHPGDAAALADAMRRLATDASLRQRMGRQAKTDFDDHLNYDHFYSEIKEIYV